MAPPTLLSHKTSFLTTQTLHLSQPLAPSAVWLTTHRTASSTSSELSDRAVDEALHRLNQTLTQHARRVYAPQATRHVAEQLEALYLRAADARQRRRRREDAEGTDEEGGLEAEGGVRGLDLSRLDPATLPASWPSSEARASETAEALRYEDLRASLVALADKRVQVRQRVERLRSVRALLLPFSPAEDEDETMGAEGQEGEGLGAARLQDNLVTRNGAVERELERMRMLLVRVAGRVAGLEDAGGGGGGGEGEEMVEDMDVVERRKVNTLLQSW